jgi:secernin
MDKLDFAATFLDPKVPLQVSHIRLQRSRQLPDDILKAHGQVSFDDPRRVLSDHYEDTFLAGPLFNPARPDFLPLCMHDHPAGFTWVNTRHCRKTGRSSRETAPMKRYRPHASSSKTSTHA